MLILFLLVTVAARAKHAPWQKALRPAIADDDVTSVDVTNVILFIGDGMGPVHVEAASLYLGRPLVFETFPHTSSMTTHSTSKVTDSAAAATAIATGERVDNEVVSVDLPGDGRELPTVLENWQAQGKATGLVTTSHITDASPAAFAAHEADRDNEDAIALDYFLDTRPNVLLGGGADGASGTLALGAGYTVVIDAAEMQTLDTDGVTHLSGQFGEGKMRPINHGREPLPSLAQMTETALDVLDNDPDGFFLMVEQEGTDSYSHGNNLELMVDALIELEEAVNTALDWADDHGDTMIIVTADHETGGLQIDQDNGAGELPDVSWEAESRHTDAEVPIYARGPRAPQIVLVDDITELSGVMAAGGGPGGLGYRLHLPLFRHLPR